MARTQKFNSVTFIEVSTEVKETLQELSKTALRKSGNVIREKLKERIPIRSDRFKNHIATWTFIDRKTGQAKCQVGFRSWQQVKKRHKQPSHANPHWIEFGVKPHDIRAKRGINIHGGIGMMYDKSKDTIYGWVVNHPGTQATHVLRNTVQDNIAEIRKAQEEYLSEISKTLEEAGIMIDQGDEFEDDD